MPRVLIVCPSANKPGPTGLTMDAEASSMEVFDERFVHCPHCQLTRGWATDDAYREDAETTSATLPGLRAPGHHAEQDGEPGHGWGPDHARLYVPERAVSGTVLSDVGREVVAPHVRAAAGAALPGEAATHARLGDRLDD
jgi:hypothetical protein